MTWALHDLGVGQPGVFLTLRTSSRQSPSWTPKLQIGVMEKKMETTIMGLYRV